MIQALKSRERDPKRDICRWNSFTESLPSVLVDGFEPTPANPVVFHLHGHTEEPSSMVLTEDDYLDFLVNISSNHSILPHQIQKALAGSSLVFLGYSLQDWNFRVIFRGLVTSKESSLRRISIAVQLEPEQKDMQQYLDKYFNEQKIHVYWGVARDFAAELRQRWEDFSNES